MKKTLTVNLGGTVYNIDEDAYVLLDTYLNNLRYHFRKNPEGEEIVRDMENRIAELFDEYLREGGQVVSVENVEAVISRMGKPEELNDGEVENSDAPSAGEERVSEPKRRLFRNPDDKVLGGVLSGLAAYFGWDVVALRLLLIVLGCFINWLIVVYLIVWIVMPQARTATEKLQMRGQPVNMENIGRTVTGGFDKKDEEPAHRSVLYKIGEVLVSIFGFLLKFCLVVLAICFLPAFLLILVVAFALMMAAFGLLASTPEIFSEFYPIIDWSMVHNYPVTAGILSVCALLAVVIPLVGLVQVLMQVFGNWKPMSTVGKLLLILLWLTALIVGGIIYLQSPFFFSYL